MPHPVAHFEILGRNQKLLEEFYKGIFNWEITPLTEDYSMAKPGVPATGLRRRGGNPAQESTVVSAQWAKHVSMSRFMLQLRTLLPRWP